MLTKKEEAELEELLQQLPDSEYNYHRIFKVIRNCPRCMQEWDRAGGMRVTLDEDLVPRIERAYQKYLKKVGEKTENDRKY